MSPTVERMSGSSSMTRTSPLSLPVGRLGLPLAFSAQWRRGRRPGLGSSGKCHVEGRAATIVPAGTVCAVACGPGRVIHPDAPAVLLGDAFADEQAEAHPGEAAVVNVCASMEALEDIR